MNTQVTCGTCGKLFDAWAFKQKKHRKFCSRACFGKSIRRETIGFRPKPTRVQKFCKRGHELATSARLVKKKSGGLHRSCRECAKVRRKTDPNVRRYEKSSILQWYYNITIEDYEALLSKQNSQCAICGARRGSSRQASLHVDHDHLTGKVRGLLCSRCNLSIGAFKDDLGLLRRAAYYLEERQ